MSNLTKVACFCSSRGKINFENLLVLEKLLKNLPFEKKKSFTYFQLNWGTGNNQEGWIFSNSSQIGGGDKLTSEGKN